MTLNLKRVENPILHLNLHMKILLFSFRSVLKYIENLVDIYDSRQDFGTEFWKIWYLFCKTKINTPKRYLKRYQKGTFWYFFWSKKVPKIRPFLSSWLIRNTCFLSKRQKRTYFWYFFRSKKVTKKYLFEVPF